MSDDCPTYEDVKEIAKELGRSAATLIALEYNNDPFYITPNREEEAKWFAKFWRRFNCQPGTHNRRVHYMLISQPQPVLMLNGEPYENTTNCMIFLNRASRDARYLDLVPLRDVVDRRNDEAIINLSEEEEDAASIETIGGLQEHVPPSFETPSLTVAPPVVPQRYHVEIWCEKSTMNDVLLPLGERYGINVVTGLGELSLTRCVELVDRAIASSKPVRILYLSDFDPGGASMPVAVARKIEFVVRKEGHDLDVQVRPVVLTKEQVLEYDLPPIPMKEGEKRAEAFMERYGVEGATELDALEALHPGELQQILEREIERYYDTGLNDQIDDAVNDAQAELDDINTKVQRQHAKAIKELEAERKKVVAAITAFENKANPVLRKIELDLEAEAPDVDSFEWPEPDDGDEDDDPLYDSTRDYVEQVDRYKEHQGKPIERKVTEKTCLHCGETFEATRWDQRFCSQECKNRYNSKQRSELRDLEKLCMNCGTKFDALRLSVKFCCNKCRDAFNDRKKRGPKVMEMACIECGTKFKPTRNGMKFCGKKCKSAFFYKQKRGE